MIDAPGLGRCGVLGISGNRAGEPSASGAAVELLSDYRPYIHTAHSALSSSTHSTVILPTHSTVILNAVKDPRLPLDVSTWRHFRVGDRPTTTPIRRHHLPPTALSSSTHSTVILNAVKDLRLPLRISTWRYFRVDDHPPRTRTKLLFMADTTPFTYGDEVCIINGEYKGRSGAVVGMNDPEKPSVFTIEFGDGSDAEIPAEFLERDPD